MRRIEGHFGLLHTTESLLGRPQVHNDVLVVPFRQVYPMKGHPITDTTLEHFSGRMIFEGVSSSVRTVWDYIPNSPTPGAVRTPRQESDGPFPDSAACDVHEFAFEGILDSPEAWVDWIVRARRFVLEVDET